MDIDFSNLLSRPFEQMVQALSVRVIAPGVEVFGDGPDGGREASYLGKMAYPSAVEGWNGYLVIQAKFKQRTGTPRQDVGWLVGQLRGELDMFLAMKDHRRPPEYYILATNIRLSGGQTSRGRSGQDKIDDVFKEYAQHLGIKGWSVWHADKLRTLLEGEPGVRQTYADWITKGDVFKAALDRLEGPSFSKIFHLYLCRQLRDGRDIRLQQAGHGGEGGTQLSEVFIDLPCAVGSGEELSNGDEAPNLKLLDYIVSSASSRLNNASVASSRRDGRTDSNKANSKTLVLGGPGQGKSTMSQFLAQIYRARALLNSQAYSIPSDIRSIASATWARAQQQDISATGVDRFPIRVDLPELADELQQGSCSSVLSYIASDISKVTGRHIDVETMSKWLANYPWILLLDGLDEVPRSANRKELIRLINEFDDEVFISNADVYQVVLTRPQGYNDDLSSHEYGSVYLTPISSDIAREYAGLLANYQIAQDSHRGRVLRRFDAALSNSTTERMLKSPLQVAIMLALLDQKGDAPTDKWRLFEGYYQVIYNRERTKFGPVSDILRDRQTEIDAIHELCGFLLQLESGRSGETESHLTPDRFRAIVEAYLIEDGHEGAALKTLVDSIVDASTERLVFLSSRVEGRVAFDVRSLQEFMAAAKIMGGDHGYVVDRLRAIASFPHWRHVFQIAASKSFSVTSASNFRDAIVAICAELNVSQHKTDRLVRAGDYLALSLIEEGISQKSPRYNRTLTLSALGVAEHGPDFISPELTRACQSDAVRSAVSERLIEMFHRTEDHVRLGAYRLVASLTSQREAWASELLATHWPSRADDTARMLEWLGATPLSETLQSAVDGAVAKLTPSDVRRLSFRQADARRSKHHWASRYPYLQLLAATPGEPAHFKALIASDVAQEGLRASFMSVQGTALNCQYPPSHDWDILRELAKFQADPTSISLASTVLAIGEGRMLSQLWSVSTIVPWPVATVCALADSDEDLLRLAIRAESGEFGDHAEWIKLEAKLAADGISTDALSVWSNGTFFGPDVTREGLPKAQMLWLTHRADGGLQIDSLIKLWRQTASPLVRGEIAWALVFLLEQYRPINELIRPLEFSQLMRDQIGERLSRYFDVLSISNMTTEEFEDKDFRDNIAILVEETPYPLMSRDKQRSLTASAKMLPIDSRAAFQRIAYASAYQDASFDAVLNAMVTSDKPASSDSAFVRVISAITNALKTQAEFDVDLAKELPAEVCSEIARHLSEVSFKDPVLSERLEGVIAQWRYFPLLNVEAVAHVTRALLRRKADRTLSLSESDDWKRLGLDEFLLDV